MNILWQDIKIFLSLLNVRKIYNYCLLKLSFYASRLFKKPIVWAYPVAISVEPTTACNLGCPACPSGLRAFSRPTGNMKEDTFQIILSSLHPYLLHINFYFQGEPLIHPKITQWIHTAAQHHIYTMLSTNAHFLDQENCHRIVQSGLHKMIISIDGMTQDVYEKYRIRGNLEKVLNGIDNLIAVKKSYHSKTPIIVLQWIAFEHNLHELKTFIQYCKAKKLAYQIKTAQVYSIEQRDTLVPKNEKYTRYTLNTNILQIKNTLYNHCWRMWASCVFTQDGKIVPCCFDKDAKYSMGDIHIQTFHSIWHSTTYNTFRKKILVARHSIDICNNCSEGSQVWS